MKLVEKRCPNCSASLSFDEYAKSVTCNYCGTSFKIEKDASDVENKDDNVPTINVKLVKKISMGVFIVWALVFIFILTMFLIMFFTVFPKVMW